MKEPMGLLLVLGGLFAIAGGLFDWEWFTMILRKCFQFHGNSRTYGNPDV